MKWSNRHTDEKRVDLLRKWKTLSHAFVSGLGTLATYELLKDPTESGVDEREYGEIPHRPGHEDNAANELCDLHVSVISTQQDDHTNSGDRYLSQCKRYCDCKEGQQCLQRVMVVLVGTVIPSRPSGANG